MNLSTGIEELDVLLFGDPLRRRSGGFSPGEVVVIRGEPGSGKTTLAYQIASNILRKNPLAVVQFVTMEESKGALQKKQLAYGFHDENITRIAWIERREAEAWLKKVAEPKLRSNADHSVGDQMADQAVEAGKVVTAIGTDPVTGAVVSIAAPGAKKALRHAFRGARKSLDWFARRVRKTESQDCPNVVLIDSLNAFMNLLTSVFPQEKPRLLSTEFCEALRAELRDVHSPPVILLTGEYHFHERDVERHIPESFFCDIEIVLRTEPLRVPGHNVSGEKFALGYDVAALIEPDTKSVESRSFCRVPKSRNSTNQSRRCAYDIVAGHGVRFFETYPGDGRLMLFAENEQQRRAWQSFIHRDLTDAYPALRWELFSMSGLQNVYESTRRLHNMPLRTDMSLCSFDSYWLAGYRDYRVKRLIGQKLRDHIDEHCDALLQRPYVDKHTFLEFPPPRQLATPEQTIDQPRAPGVRTKRSELACLEFPRLVNDCMHYALLQLDLTLLEKTRDNANAERGERLSREIDELRKDLEDLRVELRSLYADVSSFLYGKDFLTVADEVTKDLSLTDTFLRPLPRSKIELFGQYDGNLLSSLTREDMHEYRDGEDHWLSIPYDANIGVFVVREDLLEKIRSAEGSPGLFSHQYTYLKQQEVALLERLRNLRLKGVDDEVFSLSGELPAFEDKIDDALRKARAELAGAPASWSRLHAGARDRLSWDQVIALCAISKTHGFGIETRSFDTLIAFFLELVWNCGGKLRVNARYQMSDRPVQVIALVRALHYFSAIFELTDTSPNQTVDPTQYGTGADRYGNWLFARLWYSTLVDALTATRAQESNGGKQFVWQGDGSSARPELEIIEMPSGLPDRQRPHFTCWGDWHFALLAGSENVALACDLISNLMGSLKVTERGLRGAGLPTVKEFYERYANQRCIPHDMRSDFKLPSMTFGQLRDTYLEPREDSPPGAATTSAGRGGIFRQSLFDYRHCAREIYSILLDLKNSAQPYRDEQFSDRLVAGAFDIVARIEDFRNRYMLIGDSFRHDVLRTAERLRTKKRAFGRLIVANGRCDVILATPLHMMAGVKVHDISRGGCRVELAPAQAGRVTGLKFGDEEFSAAAGSDPVRGSNSTGVTFTTPLNATNFQRVVRCLQI